MASKFGLGKGLGALIPERLPVHSVRGDKVEVATGFDAENPDSRSRVDGEELLIIPLSRIKPNPDQPRKDFSEASIDELASSIKRHGLIQPILVEESDEGDYQIIAGERRYRAALRAGLEELPAIVRTLSHERRLEISLIENIQRENLNPVEEAEAFRSLMEISGATQDEVADAVGKSRSAIANSVRLLRLAPRMLDALRTGGISAGHARALLSLPDAPVRDKLFSAIMDESLSVRQSEEIAQSSLAAEGINKKVKAAPKKTAALARDPDLVAVEQKLIQSLGTKVVIKGDSRKGSIEVEYYSMEDLDRIVEVLAK